MHERGRGGYNARGEVDEAEKAVAAAGVAWRRPHPLSCLRLAMLVSLAFAIDFCYSVEVGYGVPALLKTGVDEKYATVIWGVGPLLGVLFQGYLGSASDRCTSSWGRRRPFIAAIAAGLGLSLLVFPYGRPIAEALSLFLGWRRPSSSSLVVCLTFGSLVLLDFCLDQLQAAVRMYLLDSVPTKDGERGNFMYSAAMGLGACFGSALSAVSWEEVGRLVTVLPKGEDTQVRVVFAGALAVVLVCTAASLASVKESDPTAYSSYGSADSPPPEAAAAAGAGFPLPGVLSRARTVEQSPEPYNKKCVARGSESESAPSLPLLPAAALVKNGASSDVREVSSTSFSLSSTQPAPFCASAPVPPKVGRTAGHSLLLPHDDRARRWGCGFSIFSSLFSPVSCLVEVYRSVRGTVRFARRLSPAMLHLWASLFLQWTSVLVLYIFFTDYVGEVVYGGTPTSTNATLLALYDRGVRAGCWYQSLLNLSGFLYSFFSDNLIRRVGLRRLMGAGHFLLLLSAGLGTVSCSSFNLLVMSVVCGVVLSNLLAIPYALIPYYEEAGLLLQSSWPINSGSDMRGKAVAFLYTSMFLSQFFTASTTGPLIEAYGSASAIMGLSFLFSSLALPTIFLLIMKDTPTSTSSSSSLRGSLMGMRTMVRKMVGGVVKVVLRI